MHRLGWIFIVNLIFTPALVQAAEGNAGQMVFSSNCSVCHSAKEGVNKIGPSLYGVVGRHAGNLKGYNYSSAMKNYDKIWDQTTLAVFLQNPRGTVPGTRMSFPGLHSSDNVQKLIVYLAGLK